MNFELKWIDLQFKLGEPTRISLDIKIEDNRGSVIHCKDLTGEIWVE